MTDPFDSPGTAENIEWADFLGKLLMVWPIGKEKVTTKDYGDKDTIRADMVVVDGADGPEDWPDILIFPLVLQGQLKRKLGKIVLGRLGKEKDELDSKGRVTRKGAWKLQDPSEEDKVKAREFLSKRPGHAVKVNDTYDDVPF